MVLVVDPLEPLPAHVGVDLSRSDVRVSQHELQASQIRSALEKMGGEGVAHHVGGERSLDSREASVSLQKLEESLAGHGPPAPAQEQTSLARLRGEERPARDQVTLDPLLRRAAVGDDALLPALSPADQVVDLEMRLRIDIGVSRRRRRRRC